MKRQISFWLIALILAPLYAGAEERNWLPPGSETRPSRPIPEWIVGGELDGSELIGRLLFHSPSLLGEQAVRLRISCASCHPSGHRNGRFFIPAVSHQPGEVDLTNSFWHSGGEDFINNPKRIPSLQSSRHKTRFGTGPVFNSLGDFTRHVIVDEFGGPPPGPEILKFLTDYMNKLSRPNQEDAAPLPRPIPFATYVEIFREVPKNQPFVARLLLEEAGRRQRHERNPIYMEVAAELKKLRSGALTEADQQQALESLEKLSRRIP